MAATGIITINGVITGLSEGQKTLSASVPLANAVGATLDVSLVSGDNTFQVPTGATYVMIIPPVGNTQALKLGGSAGFVISKTNPGLYPLDPSTTSFVINAAGVVTGTTVLSFA